MEKKGGCRLQRRSGAPLLARLHRTRWTVHRIPFPFHEMAEGVGFEPTVPSLVQRFSRPPQSATLSPLRVEDGNLVQAGLQCKCFPSAMLIIWKAAWGVVLAAVTI